MEKFKIGDSDCIPFVGHQHINQKKLENYNKVVKLLDDHAVKALETIIELMDHEDPYVQLRSAELILKKVLPDRKVQKVVGDKDNPVRVEVTDRREAVRKVINLLDDIEIDVVTGEIVRDIESEAESIYESVVRREDFENEKIAAEERDGSRRNRYTSGEGETESDEISEAPSGRDLSPDSGTV